MGKVKAVKGIKEKTQGAAIGVMVQASIEAAYWACSAVTETIGAQVLHCRPEYKRTWPEENRSLQAFLNYNSGFSQGASGIATEVAAYSTVTLDLSKRDITGSSSRSLADSNGDAVDQWSKLDLANVTAEDANLGSLFSRADAAIYEAKRQGKNRVVQST